MTTYTYNTNRTGTIDLKVEVNGQLIATVDDRLVAGREKARWQELTLYRLLRGGYVLQFEELTTRDEPEFVSVVVCDDAQDVLDALTEADEADEVDFVLAYELLKIAAQRHISFREIWDEIAKLNPWDVFYSLEDDAETAQP